MSAGFDRRWVRRRFSAAAGRYSAVAVLQREVENRLLERNESTDVAPELILDVGCGPGRAAGILRKRYRRSQIVALDLALPMLVQARRQGGWLRSIPAVCADAGALPLTDVSVDLLFSNLCLQWLDDPAAVFSEFRRVLKPGGRMLLATFGPDTLAELRDAWASVDGHPHVSVFASMAMLGDALMTQGFRDPVLDRDLFTLSYASLDDLFVELRAIGANNSRRDRARGLAGKSAWRRMRQAYGAMRDGEGRYPATYEVIYLQAFAPEPGQPRRVQGAEIATIPISVIRRR